MKQGKQFSQRKGLVCVFLQRAQTLYQEMSVAFSLPGLSELLSSLEAIGREESRMQGSVVISQGKGSIQMSASG